MRPAGMVSVRRVPTTVTPSICRVPSGSGQFGTFAGRRAGRSPGGGGGGGTGGGDTVVMPSAENGAPRSTALSGISAPTNSSVAPIGGGGGGGGGGAGRGGGWASARFAATVRMIVISMRPVACRVIAVAPFVPIGEQT